MNYKIALLPLLVAGMLASCNSDEEIIRTNPDYVEAGYGALTVTLTNPGKSLTKAGEELTGVATDEEMTIKSVAFFVSTGNEEVDNKTLYGNFGAYFSTEELLSANGLQEGLQEEGKGQYTAKIRHQSDGWASPKVIVIANYAENGLTETLKGVAGWEDLANVLTEELNANPQTPLLMYATKEIGSWLRSGGNSSGGGTANETFDLQRLVSRIDIHNYAYVDGNESEGFVLKSARLVRPKKKSYLLPDNAGSGLLAVATEPFPVIGTPVYDGENGYQKLDTLYVYENANAEAASATAVQIDGTYRGGNISKIIEFKKADGVGTIGDPIALARNTRYVININPAPDSTDITWNIKVKAWAEADTIKVKPVYSKPELTEIEAGDILSADGMEWDAEKKLITTNGTSTASMTFKTYSTTASVYDVVFEYDTDGSSIDGEKDDIVKRGTPIISYAAQVETPFTVNVPLMKADELVPVDIHIIIRNGSNADACDTLTIRRRPDYPQTSVQPVLMAGPNGKKLFWAPVNVGAVGIPTSVPTTGDITGTCGKIFQWGRKVGFAASTDAVTTTATLVSDTTDFESNDTWKKKFVTSNSDWLSDKIDDLWNKGREDAPVKTVYDPCPAGWRVPTMEEWGAIGAGNSNIVKGWGNGLMTISGVDGKELVLPAAGYRDRSSGASGNQGSYGAYWSSSPSGASASYVSFSSATLNTNPSNRAGGYSVRCVQE